MTYTEENAIRNLKTIKKTFFFKWNSISQDYYHLLLMENGSHDKDFHFFFMPSEVIPWFVHGPHKFWHVWRTFENIFSENLGKLTVRMTLKIGSNSYYYFVAFFIKIFRVDSTNVLKDFDFKHLSKIFSFFWELLR